MFKHLGIRMSLKLNTQASHLLADSPSSNHAADAFAWSGACGPRHPRFENPKRRIRVLGTAKIL